MKVEQIYNILNTITEENLGDSIVVAEDLSNIVEIGDTIQNVMGLDNYVRKLVDHIGRVIFVDRVYTGRVLFVQHGCDPQLQSALIDGGNVHILY